MTTDPELDRDLDDWIGYQVPVVQGEGDGPGRVMPAPDEDAADKLLFRERRLRQEAAKIRAHADQRIKEIQSWADDRLGFVRHDQARVRRSLDGFTRAFIRANPKRKSIPLTNGTLKLTAPGRGRIDVLAEHEFIAWAEANGRNDLLRYKPEVNKARLAELMTEERLAPRPGVIAEDDYGHPETRHQWALMFEVGQGEEREIVSAPGVIYSKAASDKFSFKVLEELQGTTEDEEEA